MNKKEMINWIKDKYYFINNIQPTRLTLILERILFAIIYVGFFLLVWRLSNKLLALIFFLLGNLTLFSYLIIVEINRTIIDKNLDPIRELFEDEETF